MNRKQLTTTLAATAREAYAIAGTERPEREDGTYDKLALTLYATRASALAARAMGLNAPKSRRAAEAVRGCLKLAPMRKGLTEPLAGPGRTEDAKALNFWRRWHASGGDITGLMYRTAFASAEVKDTYDKFDSLVQCIRTIRGAGKSRAVSAWNRALYGN